MTGYSVASSEAPAPMSFQGPHWGKRHDAGGGGHPLVFVETPSRAIAWVGNLDVGPIAARIRSTLISSFLPLGRVSVSRMRGLARGMTARAEVR